MIPKAWIFFAFFFAQYVKNSQADSAACATAVSEYGESADSFLRAATNFSTNFVQNTDRNVVRDTAEAQGALDDICEKMNASAQAAENVISRCSQTTGPCPKYSRMPSTPDMIRTGARLCKSVQAEEYIPHIQTLLTCQKALQHRAYQSNLAASKALTPLPRDDSLRLQDDEIRAAQENSTGACGYPCGRKCVCRMIQIEWQAYLDEPNGSIREVCGQQAHDLEVMLQGRLLNALHCSDFGDYVKELGWLKVNYRANKATSAFRH